MGRKKRPKQLKESPSIQFEVEDDALELMEQAMESVPSDIHREKSGSGSSDPISSGSQPKSGKPTGTKSIDLHGHTLAEAKDRVRRTFQEIFSAARSGTMTITIITGKGLHSGPGGSVLPRDVHHFVKTEFANKIDSIESSPADNLINGIPIRGHFKVVLRW